MDGKVSYVTVESPGNPKEKIEPGIYFSTFDQFDKYIGFDLNTQTFIEDDSQPRLTVALENLYSSLISKESAEAYQKRTSNYNQAVNNLKQFWSQKWTEVFGCEQALAIENSTSEWVTLQNCEANTDHRGTNILQSDQEAAIQNSILWMFNMATSEGNIDYALTNKGRKYLISENQQASGSQSLGDSLYNLLIEGREGYQFFFTGNINQFESNPWPSSLLDDYLSIHNDLDANYRQPAIYDQNNSRIEQAKEVLYGYKEGGKTAENLIQKTPGSYTDSYTAGGRIPLDYPQYLPNLDPTYLSESSIENLILNGNGQHDISFNIDAKSEDSFEFNSDLNWLSKELTSSSFYHESEPKQSSPSPLISTPFDSYDENFILQSIAIEYKGVSQQQWSPRSIGTGSWLLLEAINGPTGVFSNNRNAEGKFLLPYAYSPNFKGGYGFQTSEAASIWLKKGLSYKKGILFTTDPQIKVLGESKFSSSQQWSQDQFDLTGFSSSNGIGLSEINFGVGETNSSYDFNNTIQTSTSQINSKSESDQISVNVNYSSRDQLNPNGEPSSKIAGWEALQIGTVYQQLAAPFEFNTVPSNKITDNSKTRATQDILPGEIIISRKKIGKALLVLSNKSNVFLGHQKKDIVHGRDGHDELYGFRGNDVIRGNKGNDFLSGGKGNNVMTGGRGSDYFEFSGREFNKMIHIITDFQVGKDILWMTHNVLPDSLTSRGNKIFYDDKKIGVLEGLDSGEVFEALSTAVFL